MIMPLTNVEQTSAQRGEAHLTVESIAGQSAVTSAQANNPMKLLTPRARGQSVWAYTSSFGGGLVAGDETQLDLRLGPNARCFLGTQASTKVYRNPRHRACGHVTRSTVEENALLIFAPDPVQPFAESRYIQRQTFHLGSGAGLMLVDWFSSGRAARGERWAFSHFQSRNEVWVAPVAAGILPAVEPGVPPGGNGAGNFETEAFSQADPGGRMPPSTAGGTPAATQRIFLDSLLLDSTTEPITSPHRTGRFNCFAMLLLVGEPLQTAAAGLLAEIATRPVERGAALVCSASPVRGGAVLRIAGESVEQVGHELHHHFEFTSALLGDDPWARKW